MSSKKWLYYNDKQKLYCISGIRPDEETRKYAQIMSFDNATKANEFVSENEFRNYIPAKDLNDFIKTSKNNNTICGYNFDIHSRLMYSEKKFNENLDSDEANAYIDGSYFQNKKACGSGVWFETDSIVEQYCSLTRKKENLALGNNAAEIIAVIMAIQTAVDFGVTKLNIFFDCNCVQDWAIGRCKSTSAFAKAYYKYIQKIRNDIELNFIKVKAHNGIWGNCAADSLARTAVRMM